MVKRVVGLLLCAALLPLFGPAQDASAPQDLDGRVRQFLEAQKDQWREENVTAEDGRFLYDLIVRKNYTRVLEIGTSTGHSGLWLAWALSRTGGTLVTIEIEEFRHLAAVRNFKAAGLDGRIDARLGDARRIIDDLDGPFDLIFVDADKNWALNYFKALLPKLAAGGCFAIHGVTRLGYLKGIRDFLEHVRALPLMDTVVEDAGGGGISLSFKKKNPA